MIFSVIWFVFTVFGSGALVAGLLFLWTGGQLGEVSEKLTPQQAELHLAELEKQRQQEEEARERKQREVRLDRLQQQNEALQEEITRKQEERRQQRTLTKRFGEVIPEAPVPTPEPQNFYEKLRSGISKTREQMLGGLSNALLGKKEIDEEVLDSLEEALLGADIGPETTEQILEVVTSRVERQELRDVDALREVIKGEIVRILHKEVPIATVADRKPLVLMFVGVNGVGKTTTIGKIAAQYRRDGHRVLMGAGDTFRAAAIEQLTEWSRRADCDIIAKSQGADPSSVMYEAVEKAVREEYDVVICDTAGRLHTKKNLMEELRKMVRVIRKVVPDAPHEVLLVLDATTGQNAIFQAREFREAADLTGIVMTKLDGTAKGGVIIGIVNEFDIPVRYIGVGEGIEDLRPYDAKQFTDSLFS
jgi:fused signal recognition particle receptor